MDLVKLKILSQDQDLITMGCNLNRLDLRLELLKEEKLQGNHNFQVQGNMLRIDLFLLVQNMVSEMRLNL